MTLWTARSDGREVQDATARASQAESGGITRSQRDNARSREKARSKKDHKEAERRFGADLAAAVDKWRKKQADTPDRWQRWATTARCILRRTLRLDEPVEVSGDQHRLQLIVEGMTRRPRQICPRHQHVRLPFPLSSQSHPLPAFFVRRPANQITADFVNGLLWEALEAGALTDGSMARFLLFRTPHDYPPRARHVGGARPN